MSGWALQVLTARDQELLSGSAERVSFSPGHVILREGTRQRDLYLIRNGFVRITRSHDGREITIAQLGPGSIFGEMSFLDNVGVSASVVAEDPVEVEVVYEHQLMALMGSEPGFATRFYQSLARELARRLRRMNQRVLDLSQGAETTGFTHAPRTGLVSERQIPAVLVSQLGETRSELWRIEEMLRAGKLAAAEARPRVHAACDAIVRLLAEFTQGDQLFEIGVSDLLAFRDTAQVETGVGAYIFRETFSLWMTSALMARCYTKPSGYPNDLQALAAIYSAEPGGDGYLGPLIDSWFLARPVCAGRREARRWLLDRLRRRAAEGAGGLSVTTLGAEAGSALVDLLTTTPDGVIYATCIDADQRALLTLAERVEASGCRTRINLVHASMGDLARGEMLFSQPPQHVIASLGLMEMLSEQTARGVLDWAYTQLGAGGEFCWSNPVVKYPDRDLLQHLLEWTPSGRDGEEIATLVTEFAFRARPVLDLDPTGTLNLVVCSKGTARP